MSAKPPQNMQTILLPVSIDPSPQLTATLISHNLPWPQHQIFTSSRVPTPAFTFLIHAELAEPRDKDILTGFQSGLDGLQQGLHDVDGFVSGETDF